jgi:AcrR family transcriptional regulator
MDDKIRSSARRPSGRTAFQQEQKRATRDKLIAAARAVFAEKGYAAATVDDILKQAEISRGAFYAHFEDKFAVFETLFEEVRASAYVVFEHLAQLQDPSIKQIERWLEEELLFVRASADLLFTSTQVAAIEPVFERGQHAFALEVIRILGKGFPAFALAMTDTTAGKEAMIRALMLLVQIGAISNSIISSPEWVDPALAIKVLAQYIHEFIHRDVKKPKIPATNKAPAKKAPAKKVPAKK